MAKKKKSILDRPYEPWYFERAKKEMDAFRKAKGIKTEAELIRALIKTNPICRTSMSMQEGQQVQSHNEEENSNGRNEETDKRKAEPEG